MTEMTAQFDGITYVVPCGGQKLDHSAPARDLYTGAMFRHTLAAAEANAQHDQDELGLATRILVLSARYGLVELATVLDPYDQRMDKAGSITADEIAGQALALGIDWGSEVYALLPAPYLRRLDEALRTLDVYVQDVYEATTGIGEQRHVNAVIAQPTAKSPASPVGEDDGVEFYLGGDVAATEWGGAGDGVVRAAPGA